MFSVWVHPWPFKHILEISLANRKSRSEPLTATSSPLREDRDSDLKVTVGASPTPVPISLLLLMTATPRGLDATNRPVSATSLGAGGCRRKEGHLPRSVASARHRGRPGSPARWPLSPASAQGPCWSRPTLENVPAPPPQLTRASHFPTCLTYEVCT